MVLKEYPGGQSGHWLIKEADINTNIFQGYNLSSAATSTAKTNCANIT